MIPTTQDPDKFESEDESQGSKDKFKDSMEDTRPFVVPGLCAPLTKDAGAHFGQPSCHQASNSVDHVRLSTMSSMRSRVSNFLEHILKADPDRARVGITMLPMHWASLLMGTNPEGGLLRVLTDALDIALPQRLMLKPQQAADEQQQGDAISQRLQQQLLSLPPSHAVCLVEWDFLRSSVKVQGSDRLDSQFLNRKTIEQGLMTHKLSCHELWASLIEHASIEEYWQLALSTLFKQEQAAAFLQVRDRFGVPSYESCTLGLASTSPHAMRSFAWLIMAPAAHRVVE